MTKIFFGHGLVIQSEPMPIDHKRNLLFTYCIDLHRAIIKDNFHVIGAYPSCSELAFEIIKSGINKEGPVTRFEVLLFDKIFMPPSLFFLDKDSVLNDIFLNLIQLI
jgi:hypothetical protein